MNKITKLICLAAFALVGLTSCETYEKADNKNSSIGPYLSGEWINVVITDVATGKVVAEVAGLNNFKTYETTAQDGENMWVWLNASQGLRLKVPCNPQTLTFGPATGMSTLAVGGVFFECSVLEGKVERGAYTTATGGKADLITMIYTSDAPVVRGKTLKVVAWRDTLWPEDQ